jgi:hypothetical protein
VRFRRPDVCIELGGIAKGFAVDRALQNPAGARADARPGERGRPLPESASGGTC